MKVTVRLWAVAGEQEAFRAFEDAALAIMAERGVRILAVHRPEAPGAPDEIHELEFDDQAAFDAYRSDPRLAELAGLRARGVARSEIEMSPPA